MTGKELVQSVAHLGFDSDVTSQSRLFSILTLALHMCASEFPKLYTKIYRVSGDEGLSIPLSELDGCAELDRIPLTLNGVPYQGYSLLDGKISVKGRLTGELCVRYHKRISAIDSESVEEELPLREGAHHLALLLSSYLYWQEDEPEKASEYLRQYNSERAALSRSLTPEVGVGVVSVNNW